MNVADFQTLYAFNRFANRRIVDACRAAGPEIFARPSAGSFGSIRDTLAHLAWAEWLWLERWQGRSPVKSELPEASNLAGVERILDEVGRGQQAFLDGLSDDRFAERIKYTNIKGERWQYTLGHMLQHVVNHSTYHRGQIVTLLRQANAKGVSTDFLMYFDELGGTRVDDDR